MWVQRPQLQLVQSEGGYKRKISARFQRNGGSKNNNAKCLKFFIVTC